MNTGRYTSVFDVGGRILFVDHYLANLYKRYIQALGDLGSVITRKVGAGACPSRRVRFFLATVAVIEKDTPTVLAATSFASACINASIVTSPSFSIPTRQCYIEPRSPLIRNSIKADYACVS